MPAPRSLPPRARRPSATSCACSAPTTCWIRARSTLPAKFSRARSGRGVDVVLNSLAGEAMLRSLQIVRPLGRFLELGKRDYYENSRIGLRPFRNNISYFGIDVDQLMLERPAYARRMMSDLLALFEEGVLSPLPYHAFAAADRRGRVPLHAAVPPHRQDRAAHGSGAQGRRPRRRSRTPAPAPARLTPPTSSPAAWADSVCAPRAGWRRKGRATWC